MLLLLMSTPHDRKLFHNLGSMHVFALATRQRWLRHPVRAALPRALGAFREEQLVQGGWHQPSRTSTDVSPWQHKWSEGERWEASGCQAAFLPGCQVGTCPPHGPEGEELPGLTWRFCSGRMSDVAHDKYANKLSDVNDPQPDVSQRRSRCWRAE